ncbi:esterase-like activity of phytase family protein [Pleomorphomonas sp. JP5]|uniref:esterase-like activity of phytase family protein n=1 Tax=Pleomorphomonas sp. JP5 TaxID=2942998 RepID=UPI002043A931|nr:esterase-like activity of phytase family protein [Pleomorphomonas sp. JP5]MCM5560279.1 esterase-like activity of phytase family protein [Pleomorphomonas sp. JP5]
MKLYSTLFVLAATLAAGTSAFAADLPVNKGLVAVGRLPADLRDNFGETFGSGSGMTVVDWKKTDNGYQGSLLLLPDRGYNVEGTTDYSARVNALSIAFAAPEAGKAAVADLKLESTFLLTDKAGKPLTGLDPVTVNKDNGTDLPGAVTGAVSIDPEAIVRLSDGSLMISDEYGPAIYHFTAEGKLVSATLPPKAFLPMRKGAVNFSSNNPGEGAPKLDPENPETGRQNNQGFEGMALNPTTNELTVVLQSATRQDGGDKKSTRYNTRALVYDAADPDALKLKAEYVVPLPTFKDAEGKTLVAAQSELAVLPDGRLLLLSRDSNNGWGVKGDTSLYRRVDLLDFAGATNIAGSKFDDLEPVAPKGALDASVTAAKLTTVIDINDNAELGKAGLHNGAPHDANDLSEKWEAIGVVPAFDPEHPKDVLMLIANDNDFLTTKGHQVGADYDAGADVDTMVLVYRLSLD